MDDPDTFQSLGGHDLRIPSVTHGGDHVLHDVRVSEQAVWLCGKRRQIPAAVARQRHLPGVLRHRGAGAVEQRRILLRAEGAAAAVEPIIR